MDQATIQSVIEQAMSAAYLASNKFFQEELNAVDNFPCGFAWVNIAEFEGKAIKGNTKLGKMFKAAGVRQDHNRNFQIWNPANIGCQNIDAKAAGAEAAARVFIENGFFAYADSRMD
jgi:hypothetical protein